MGQGQRSRGSHHHQKNIASSRCNLIDHYTTSATTMPTKQYAIQTMVMALVQCWTRQVASDHDLDQTLTNIIPAFDYFAFAYPSRL